MRVLGASLEEMLGEDSPLATSMPATPATEVQPEDHRNALDRKVLQKTPVLAGATQGNLRPDLIALRHLTENALEGNPIPQSRDRSFLG